MRIPKVLIFAILSIALALAGMITNEPLAHAGGYHAPTVQLEDTADGVTHSDGSPITSPALTNANGSEFLFANFNSDHHDQRAFGNMVITDATLDIVSGNTTNVCVFAMTTPFIPATRHTPAQRPYIGTQIWSSDNANGCFHLVHGHNHLGITTIFAGLNFGQAGTVSLMLYSDANHINHDANLVVWTGQADRDRLVPTITTTLGDASGSKG